MEGIVCSVPGGLSSTLGAAALQWSVGDEGQWLEVERGWEASLALLIAERDASSLQLLIDDVLLLRGSVLSDGELDVLWRVISAGSLHVPEAWGRGQGWLDAVLTGAVTLVAGPGADAGTWSVRRCAQARGSAHASAHGNRAIRRHRLLTGEVLNLVGGLEDPLDEVVPLAVVRSVLVRMAQAVCSELAFRFLLRCHLLLSAPLSRGTYQRARRVSQGFGHCVGVVESMRLIVV
ncbi:hypothetical protein [Streptomyces sp. SP18CS02]|uniref:hypothetical protein n=1 Tax=Streptomyces sp. SP18CS02 TaxID=3002531 RepID=UPI002E773A88|nr:hypothetical protein [Streptomyces sp. SP18CS02]MEE1751212.1 hypothetical protein [Streptomyces sp. SP18CS02]